MALMTAMLSLSGAEGTSEEAAAVLQKDVVILFTSDVHCGINKGFGLGGLKQIRDSLEWGAWIVPEESGAFCHVSGMTYEIHTYIPSSCRKTEDGMFAGVEGEYRVKNVMIGGEPLDPERKYTVAGQTYALIDRGSGQTGFDGGKITQEPGEIDFIMVASFIQTKLNGVVGEEYADPYGQGRVIGISTRPKE